MKKKLKTIASSAWVPVSAPIIDFVKDFNNVSVSAIYYDDGSGALSVFSGEHELFWQEDAFLKDHIKTFEKYLIRREIDYKKEMSDCKAALKQLKQIKAKNKL